MKEITGGGFLSFSSLEGIWPMSPQTSHSNSATTQSLEVIHASRSQGPLATSSCPEFSFFPLIVPKGFCFTLLYLFYLKH